MHALFAGLREIIDSQLRNATELRFQVRECASACIVTSCDAFYKKINSVCSNNNNYDHNHIMKRMVKGLVYLSY